MILFINIIHIFSCIVLIMIVLLQTGKGTDMGSAFGGGTSQTLFGSTGASTFLSKVTTIMAIIFMLTCFTLAYISTNVSTSSNSIMENKASDTQVTIPDTSEKGIPAEQDNPLTEVPGVIKNTSLPNTSDAVKDNPLSNNKIEEDTSEIKKTETDKTADNKKEAVKNEKSEVQKK